MVMAKIYTRCGRFDEAIDELEYLMAIESEYTTNSLKLIDWIDPLRDSPRFLKMMTDYAPTTLL
jgi:hypothetical protein